MRLWNIARKLAAQEAETAGQQTCPQCGREMELGSLFSGQTKVFWFPISAGRQKAPIKIDPQGVSLKKFKTAWYCRSCGKMVFIAPGRDGAPDALA